MKMMKAAVVHAFGQPLQIEDVPVPEVTAGQVLVKVVASGVCHTDVHAADGDWPVKPALPFIPGHEGVGYVAALGAGVKGIKEGDRVGVPWLHTACGHCEHCITGWETLCDAQQMTGYTVNGGYAEFVLADPALATQLGAEMVVNARTQDPAQEVQRALRGAHGVLVTAVSRAAFSQALGMLHKRGTMSLVGLPPGDFPLPIFDMVLNAKTVRGSIVGTRKDLQEALAFAGEGKVHSVFTEDRLEHINSVFARLKAGDVQGRVVMRLAEESAT
jgi:D-arabinose 1-dehydrogenase-like Zn-dependent alcohol dehydrogenase